MKTKTDAELLSIYAKSADSDAFAELVTRHSSMVYRVCFRILSNQQEAQDASQAVFMTLVKKASGIRVDGTLAKWLHTVARQTSLFLLRTKIRRSEREAVGAELIKHGKDSKISEEKRNAVLHVLDEELAALSSTQREAVILRHLQGLSVKDAAAMAGCAPNALSSRVNDGIVRLRQRLIRRGCALGIPALVGLLATESQAAVPETLIPSLIAVPKTLSAGAAAGHGAGNVITLMEGTMKMMFMAKMKTVVIGALVAGLLGAGGTVAVQAQLSKGEAVPEQQTTAKKETIAKKLNSIVIDHIEFKDVALPTVISYLNQKTKELDKEKKGVNIILKLDANDVKNPPKITIRLEDIPLGDAIKYIAMAAGMKYQVEAEAVAISK